MAKHKWQKLPNGSINHFAEYGEFHKGPICVECGHSFCEHCQPEEWESECPGREGFKLRITKSYKYDGFCLGIMWRHKSLQFCFIFWVISFDFSGLFPYCKEIREEF
jgi:hypothetical protein